MEYTTELHWQDARRPLGWKVGALHLRQRRPFEGMLGMHYQEGQALVTAHENGTEAGHLIHAQWNKCWGEQSMERVLGGKGKWNAEVLSREELERGHGKEVGSCYMGTLL